VSISKYLPTFRRFVITPSDLNSPKTVATPEDVYVLYWSKCLVNIYRRFEDHGVFICRVKQSNAKSRGDINAHVT